MLLLLLYPLPPSRAAKKLGRGGGILLCVDFGSFFLFHCFEDIDFFVSCCRQSEQASVYQIKREVVLLLFCLFVVVFAKEQESLTCSSTKSCNGFPPVRFLPPLFSFYVEIER